MSAREIVICTPVRTAIGAFGGSLEGSGRVENSKFALTSADGNLSVDRLTIDKQPIGSLKMTAATRGEDLQVQVNGSLRESTIDGQGSWRLTGNDPGSLNVRFSRMDVQTVNHLAMLGGTAEQETSELPFDGFVEGHASATLPLATPMSVRTASPTNATITSVGMVRPRCRRHRKLATPQTSTASMALRAPRKVFVSRKIAAGISDASMMPGRPRRATARRSGCFGSAASGS